jgi:hypothetical protein
MKRNLAMLLSGSAALLTLGIAQATPISPPAGNPNAVSSYAELLDPVPNASSTLQTDNERLAQQPEATVQLAQWHHHHHHHHHFWGGHFGGYYGGPYAAAPGGCYWTAGRPYWNGWRWVPSRVRVCDY